MHGTRGDLMEAQYFYEQAVASDPTYVRALMRLAWLNTQRRFDVNEYGAYDTALLQKRDDDAEEAYSKAQKAAPNDPEVLAIPIPSRLQTAAPSGAMHSDLVGNGLRLFGVSAGPVSLREL